MLNVEEDKRYSKVTLKRLSSLRIRLSTGSLSWLESFVSLGGGLKLLEEMMESIVRNRVKDRYIEVSLLIPALFFFPLPPSNNINIKTEQRGYKLELTL